VAQGLAAQQAVVKGPIRFDFEGGDSQGWHKVSGDYPHITITSTRGSKKNQPFNQHGKYFIGTGERPNNGFSDDTVCEIRSPVFTITQNWIVLLVGGGNHPNETYVALCRADDGQELLKETGRNHESMTPRRWDVLKLKGTKAFVKVVDKHRGSWGHVNVDDVRELTPEEEVAALLEQVGATRKRYAPFEEWQAALPERGRPIVYAGGLHRAAAMPLLRPSVGSVKLRCDGALADWQIPASSGKPISVSPAFFAIWAQREGEDAAAKVLQMKPPHDLPGVRNALLTGTFPIARVDYEDGELPVRVSLEAYAPFDLLARPEHHRPALVFRITAANEQVSRVRVAAAASLQSPLGPDTASRVERKAGLAAVLLLKSKSPDALCLATSDARISVRSAWSDPKQFWNDFARDGALVDVASAPDGSSSPTASIASSNWLGSGETRTFWFSVAWRASDAQSALRVATHVAANRKQIDAQTRLFRNTFYDSTLPRWLLDSVSADLRFFEPGRLEKHIGVLYCNPNALAKTDLRSVYDRLIAQPPATKKPKVPEYYKAAQLIFHDQVTQGLALAALRHDAYEGVIRNPWEQKAKLPSYALLFACQSFTYGPGFIGFAPKVTPEQHRSFFLTERAWGTLDQRRRGSRQTNLVSVKSGELVLKELKLMLPRADLAPRLSVRGSHGEAEATLAVQGTRAVIAFDKAIALCAGQHLRLQFDW